MEVKNIIITGSSSGIGKGLAKYYLSRNHNVIGLARRDNADLSDNKNYKHYRIDLTDTDSIATVIRDVKDLFRNIDLVVLNAGILGEIKRLENISLEDSKKVLEINLWSNKAFIDELLQQKLNCKQIVGISSGAAKNGSAGWGPYSISKAALNMLLQTYAIENPEIHFASVAPGLVDTAMQDYIYSLKSGDDFPTIAKLQAANGTEDMPNAEVIAPKLDALFQNVKAKAQSGIFVDIRNYNSFNLEMKHR